jgi:hypothetical protein
VRPTGSPTTARRRVKRRTSPRYCPDTHALRGRRSRPRADRRSAAVGAVMVDTTPASVGGVPAVLEVNGVGLATGDVWPAVPGVGEEIPLAPCDPPWCKTRLTVSTDPASAATNTMTTAVAGRCRLGASTRRPARICRRCSGLRRTPANARLTRLRKSSSLLTDLPPWQQEARATVPRPNAPGLDRRHRDTERHRTVFQPKSRR